jgi:hypothetical protein
MPSPFPGMDPWLEDPDVFPGFHARFITYIAEVLQPQLRARGYFIDANERVWIDESQRNIYPDVAVVAHRDPSGVQSTGSDLATADEPVRVHQLETEMRQTYLEIFDRHQRRLVTAIEVLSPVNKRAGKGRRLYRKKQLELQSAGVNLVEIDLLRRGRHTLCVPSTLAEGVRPWAYLICLWRPNQSDYELYPIPLRSLLPRIHVPLAANDTDAVLDLQTAFNRAYDAGPYPDRLDYLAPPAVELSDEDFEWTKTLLHKPGLRP